MVLWRVWICWKSIADLPGAFDFVFGEVDTEPEVFFEVEGQCSLTHLLFGLALALILGLTLICSLNLREVVVDVRLNESRAAAPGANESSDM